MGWRVCETFHPQTSFRLTSYMEFNPDIFKAYDIRGLVGKDFDDEFVETLGRAFVTYTGAKVVVAGRDMRGTSPQYFKALSEGMMAAGADVIDIGMVSTPMFYFAVENYDLHDAGIIVTASHNPSEYNGFKMLGDHPSKAIGKGAGMEEIKALVEKGKFPDVKEGTLVQTDIVPDYLEKLFRLVPPETMKGLKVVVDSGNGMGGVILPAIFEKLDVEVHKLYWEPDGTFPNHEANPLKTETLKDLQAKVLEVGADLGIALDGDSDRIGFVDEKGEPLRPDLFIALMAHQLLLGNEGRKVTYDVRCGMAVAEEIKKAGGVPLMTSVGHALIKPVIAKENALFGGELSAHFYWGEWGTGENTDFAMLSLMRMIKESKKPFSEMLAPYRRYYHTGEINFEVEDKDAKMSEVKEKYGAEGIVTELDGIRIDFDGWWLSVRASNTEPLLRLNLEAKEQVVMEEKKAELVDLLLK